MSGMLAMLGIDPDEIKRTGAAMVQRVEVMEQRLIRIESMLCDLRDLSVHRFPTERIEFDSEVDDND